MKSTSNEYKSPSRYRKKKKLNPPHANCYRDERVQNDHDGVAPMSDDEDDDDDDDKGDNDDEANDNVQDMYPAAMIDQIRFFTGFRSA